jgi:primosomal protein N' (replication factor Y)
MQVDVSAARGRVLFVHLQADPPWDLKPAAVRQRQVLDHLFDNNGVVAKKRLAEDLGPQAARAVQALAARGLVRIGGPPEEPLPDLTAADLTDGLKPTPEQESVLKELTLALDDPEPRTMLLHGVTGSGKTLVYLRLVARVLEQGRQAVLLAPEVALATSLWRAALAVFPGDRVLFHHGYLTPARKEAGFRRAAQPGPLLVVGARSALFLPLRDPALAILDEEHDESYKQDERLAYQAKEVAHSRVSRSNGLLVLGSATPDIKTWHAAGRGSIRRLALNTRACGGGLPEVKLVDMKAASDPGAILAPQTLEDLGRVLERGEQAVIMLNRRGYAPLLYCLDCSQPIRCPHCQVGMTLHKARERLLCHYCGETREFPLPCPECGCAHYVPLGEGTEQLQERLEHDLPEGTRILRLDRDAARRAERMEAILTDFAAGRAQVLVGTQMLSKGHHFPGVTRVVAAQADLGLNLPDYRSAERTFHLMVQVSGRSGRGERPGQVLIQTLSPSLPFWQFVKDCDYEGFAQSELAKRKAWGYPPYVKLALLRLDYPAHWLGGGEAVGEMAQVLRNEAARQNVRALGPAPAPLAQLKGRKRFNCLLKADGWPQLRAVFARARTSLPRRSGLRLHLDLDPVNML